MQITLKEIAGITGGSIQGDPQTVISGIAGIDKAQEGDITFLANPKYACHVASTRASAIVCAPDVDAPSKTLLQVANPYLAYAKVLHFFNPPAEESGQVDPRAVIGNNVRLGTNVTIYPFVYVEEGAVIGNNVTIYPHCFIGRQAAIGDDSLLHPGVTVRERCIIGRRVIIHPGAVIGSDGFGFAKDGAAYYKIPQLGIVQIDDDVEIGAGTTIDRAALEKTWIKRGTKTDNLVHIAHNVVIGEDSAVVAQVGISGSTQVGNRVILAGQAATVGHITIGDDVVVIARTGVSSDIPAGQVIAGSPHMPHKTWLKASRSFAKLPEMRRTISALEKRVRELESAPATGTGGEK